MGIGSLGSWYTSGSLYKKFYESNSARLNRRSLEFYDTQVSVAGSIIFGRAVAESEGLSLLAAQTMQKRVMGELQAKLETAEGTRRSVLDILA